MLLVQAMHDAGQHSLDSTVRELNGNKSIKFRLE
jgi:hypothetical protein